MSLIASHLEAFVFLNKLKGCLLNSPQDDSVAVFDQQEAQWPSGRTPLGGTGAPGSASFVVVVACGTCVGLFPHK